MNPAEHFNFFRQNVAARGDAPPMRLSFKQARELLSAGQLEKLVTGKRVRTGYGTYWAEKKAV